MRGETLSIPINPDTILNHIGELGKKADEAKTSEAPLNGSAKHRAGRTGEELLQLSKLNPLSEVPEPPVCISIDVNGKSAIFGTLGNLSVLLGKAKSKKTFVASIVVAAALRNSLLQNVIRCSFPEGKKRIVIFDTEQSEYHVWKVIMRTFALSGGSKEELSQVLDVFCLCSFNPEERVRAIDHYLKTIHGIGLVVIDGIRDLVHDINDSTQANYAAQLLRTWCSDYFIHVLTVIHQNKADGNARGHLGAEVTNKAETVAEVKKDGQDSSISTVEPGNCRNPEFEKFAFAIDDSGIPQILDGYKEQGSAKSTRAKTPGEISIETHKKALALIFKNDPQVSGTKFAPSIKVAFAEMDIKFGDHASRGFIEYYKQKGLVQVQERQAGNRTFYSLPETKEDAS